MDGTKYIMAVRIEMIHTLLRLMLIVLEEAKMGYEITGKLNL
jgi:hypothetical protein